MKEDKGSSLHGVMVKKNLKSKEKDVNNKNEVCFKGMSLAVQLTLSLCIMK